MSFATLSEMNSRRPKPTFTDNVQMFGSPPPAYDIDRQGSLAPKWYEWRYWGRRKWIMIGVGAALIIAIIIAIAVGKHNRTHLYLLLAFSRSKCFKNMQSRDKHKWWRLTNLYAKDCPTEARSMPFSFYIAKWEFTNSCCVVVGRKDTRYPVYSRLQYTLAESREYLSLSTSPYSVLDMRIESLADSLQQTRAKISFKDSTTSLVMIPQLASYTMYQKYKPNN